MGKALKGRKTGRRTPVQILEESEARKGRRKICRTFDELEAPIV